MSDVALSGVMCNRLEMIEDLSPLMLYEGPRDVEQAFLIGLYKATGPAVSVS